MRPVTGSKGSRSTRKVSIQQSLDGHSFSVSGLTDVPSGSDPVQVELLAPRTMLAPAEMADPIHARELLAANGMPAAECEEVVCCTGGGAVALAAVHKEALRQVVGVLGGRIRYTSPLLGGSGAGKRCVWLCKYASILYIKVYDDTLRLAETIAAPDESDILFLFGRLAAEFPLAEYTLRIAGDRTKRLRQMLRKYFKETTCE